MKYKMKESEGEEEENEGEREEEKEEEEIRPLDRASKSPKKGEPIAFSFLLNLGRTYEWKLDWIIIFQKSINIFSGDLLVHTSPRNADTHTHTHSND